MKLRSLLFSSVCVLGLCASDAFAVPIDYFTGSVTTANSTQFGRPSRNGVPQTWTHQEAYPGVLSSTLATTYYYTTYTYAASLFTTTPYVEISVNDELNSNLFFVSAYENSYNTANRSANWLGDPGAGGNYTFFPGSPGVARFFDVTLDPGASLVLVVNTTGGGTLGTNRPYDIEVDAYADTNYDDVAMTPEPSTFIELGTGLLTMAGLLRRRLKLA